MKKFYKKYFLTVASKPFQLALWTAVLLFIVLTIVRVIFSSVPVFSFSAVTALVISFYALLFFAALNLVVPAIFITFFYPEKRRMVIIKPTEDCWANYLRPVWGKIPYVEIIFPEGWNITDDSPSRQLELGIIFKINAKVLAFLRIKVKLNFNGNFQAADLAEMIRQQGNSVKGETRLKFKDCLQAIVIRFLSDRRELVRGDLINWQQGTLTTIELETRWFTPEIIFQNLFRNIETIEMKLEAPEFTRTHENKK